MKLILQQTTQDSASSENQDMLPWWPSTSAVWHCSMQLRLKLKHWLCSTACSCFLFSLIWSNLCSTFKKMINNSTMDVLMFTSLFVYLFTCYHVNIPFEVNLQYKYSVSELLTLKGRRWSSLCSWWRWWGGTSEWCSSFWHWRPASLPGSQKWFKYKLDKFTGLSYSKVNIDMIVYHHTF